MQLMHLTFLQVKYGAMVALCHAMVAICHQDRIFLLGSIDSRICQDSPWIPIFDLEL